MLKKVTRKNFLKTVGLGVIGAGAVGIFKFQNGNIRIRPILGRKYSPAFLALCERARFKSAQEAIRCVRDQVTEFEIVEEKS